jgi:hypothetical protein
MTGYHDDRDQRGVFVELWTIDLLDGDLPAALLLSQLLWWHQAGKDGTPRVNYERSGQQWLLRADDDWQADCRLTQKQVRRIRSVLVAKGLVEHRRFKLNGAPTSAWRPLYEGIQGAIRPNPELPSEGQFHGSDPQGAVGSDPSGAVPIPLSTTRRDTTTQLRVIRPENDDRSDAQLVRDAFTAFWNTYPRKTSKAAAIKAWPGAIKLAGGDLRRIVNGVRRYAADPNLPEARFIPHPAKWLHDGRWDDEPLPSAGNVRTSSAPAPAPLTGPELTYDEEYEVWMDAHDPTWRTREKV